MEFVNLRHTNQLFEITAAEKTVQWIGSSFESCEFRLKRAGRDTIVSECIFNNCQFTAARPFKNVSFFDSHFKGCAFVGNFDGCEFGCSYFRGSHEKGSICNSDLSRCNLELATIGKSNLDDLTLPAWPYFFVLRSGAKFPEIAELDGDLEWQALKYVSNPKLDFRSTDMRCDSFLAAKYKPHDGKNGFSISEDECRAIFKEYPAFVTFR